MPHIKYNDQTLTRYREKSGGKNNSDVDGFYKTDTGACYFVKKPKDKCELFAEAFAGKILQELKRRNFIEKTYHDSLIVADVVPITEGEVTSYALIQPEIKFEMLFNLIGTSNASGDRDVLRETCHGPEHYAQITQMQGFGLSIALLFSLLFGAHSVHSGNIVAIDTKDKDSKQFARIDWGDSFRYFAHSENSKVLQAYEATGLINYKRYTKNYILNYRDIIGLFPSIAKKATPLLQKIDQATWIEVINQALKNLPADLLDPKSMEKFAIYAVMPTFKEVTLGPKCGPNAFSEHMAGILMARMENIAQLENLSSTADPADEYCSMIACPRPSLAITKPTFAETIIDWHAMTDATSIAKVEEIDLAQLAHQFNQHFNELITHCDKLNVWEHDTKTKGNIFLPYAPQMTETKYGFAFIAQYKESTVFRHLFFVNPQTLGATRFWPYEEPIRRYVEENPRSFWAKIQRLATAGQQIIHIIHMQKMSNDPEYKGAAVNCPEQLYEAFSEFLSLQREVESAFIDVPLTSTHVFCSSHYFYPIDDTALCNMSGAQLATIVLEELNSPTASELITRIVKQPFFLGKLKLGLQEDSFNGRSDQNINKKAVIPLLEKLVQAIDKRVNQLETQIGEFQKSQQQRETAYQQSLTILQTEVDTLTRENGALNDQLSQLKQSQQTTQREKEELRLQNLTYKAGMDQALVERDQAYRAQVALQAELNKPHKNNLYTEEQFTEQVDKAKAAENKAKHIKNAVGVRLAFMAPIIQQLDILLKKSQQLKSRKEDAAVLAIDGLITSMNKAVNNYLTSEVADNDALNEFKAAANQHISQAKSSTLTVHRLTVDHAFANLALAILLVGVGYLAAMLVNKSINHTYTFFSKKTDSEKIVEQLEKTTLSLDGGLVNSLG